jgi:hypothetical protein
MAAMHRKRRIDHAGLAAGHRIVRARLVADPFRTASAEKRGADRRRDRRTADAKIAKAQKIRAAGDRLHAEGHGGRRAPLIERRFHGDVTGRQVEREVEHLEAEIVGGAKLANRRRARGAAFHLRGGCAGRQGRDVARRDAVAAGEDRKERPQDHRSRTAAPAGQPHGHFFQAAKRTADTGTVAEIRGHARGRLAVKGARSGK